MSVLTVLAVWIGLLALIAVVLYRAGKAQEARSIAFLHGYGAGFTDGVQGALEASLDAAKAQGIRAAHIDPEHRALQIDAARRGLQ